MATAFPAPQGPATHNSGKHVRPLSLVTVTIGFCLIEAALWTPKSVQLWIGLIAGAWIVGNTVLSRRPAEELGLGSSGFRQSAWVTVAAVLTAAIIISVGWMFGWLHGLVGPIPAATHALAYTVWAFQQEFILQSFMFLNLLPVLGTRRAIVLTAIVFSVAHIPNPVLTIATLISGFCLTAAFARYRNVYTIAVAHAALGLAVAVAVPADVHRNMRVGLGYFTYRPIASSHRAAPLAPVKTTLRR